MFSSINQIVSQRHIIIGLEEALGIKREGSMRCLGYIQGDQCELKFARSLRY